MILFILYTFNMIAISEAYIYNMNNGLGWDFPTCILKIDL